LTEEQLIKACLRQEAAAERELFLRFGSKMLGVCRRYARNNEDAEDMLQDAFVKVFRKLNQYKWEGSFEGWIRKVVVNTALKKYTVSRYHKEIANGEFTERHEQTEHPEIYSQLSQKDLLELVNRLPDGYRLVFNLHIMEGYPHEEIADMLGIQPGTSRSQLVKARNMLQRQIIAMQKSVYERRV
jgi:RNA polymerase sigma factor (sigma-70 family)